MVNLSGIAQQYAAFCPKASAPPLWRRASAASTLCWQITPWCWPIPSWKSIAAAAHPGDHAGAVLCVLRGAAAAGQYAGHRAGLVNKLPVIGTVNRGLGWLTGGMTALLDLYLVLCVVWGLVVITGGNLNVLNDTVMHSSLYYKAFNMFNPFL